MSQVPCLHEHMANAARVKYPVACREAFDCLCGVVGLLSQALSFGSHFLDLCHGFLWRHISVGDVRDLGQLFVTYRGIQGIVKPDIHLLGIGNYLISADQGRIGQALIHTQGSIEPANLSGLLCTGLSA